MKEGVVTALNPERVREDMAGGFERDAWRLIYEDPKTEKIVGLAERVAATEASVMICGESGTGKEMFARYIHARSRRSRGPFVAVNCAAIPRGMLEAALFGHEKGAFTGAYQTHLGKFEQAQTGTLLLDEVTEIDLDVQAKLLRVLQEKEIERLGGRKTIPLSVRILATTNRDLTREVASGRFRKDLYYRLNVFPLSLPRLAERPADILPLAKSRIRFHTPSREQVPTLTRCARQKLLQYSWPGNVRELDNVIQRALILCDGRHIDADTIHIDDRVDQSPLPTLREESGSMEPARLGDDLKLRERDLILEALRAESGNRQAAARRLGISPRTLRYKIARIREQGLGMPVILGWEGA